MRKMKKINGFLVVRFNDREKQGYPQLGSFGVIDAELYTGSVDVDLDAFEYNDADTIEVAVEQARGLNAEQDYSDEPPVYTVVVETPEEVKEEEVDPQLLINGWEQQLKGHIKSSRFKDVDPRTAAHELYGYKVALCDLGLLDREDRGVNPDHFAPGMMEQSLPRSSEELLAYVCDELCRRRFPGQTQEELDAICEKCGLNRLAGEADEQGLRLKETARGRLEGLVQELAGTQLNTKAERLEHEARAYLEALATTKTFSEQEVTIYEAAISAALKVRPEPPERETFENLPSGMRNDRNTRKVYALGLALAEECPDNDCRVYLNIFNMARELDDVLDEVKPNSAPALVLRSALIQRAGELWQMYAENYAVQQFKEGMQP